MEELSLHILDIVQNSIDAGAENIVITVCENSGTDTLEICITDDGCGMSADMLQRIMTSDEENLADRTSGRGIPLFKQAAERSGGGLYIESEPGKGTKVCAKLRLSHPCRLPVGNMALTVCQIVCLNENPDFVYTHIADERSFTLDTHELKARLGGVSIGCCWVWEWLLEYLKENEEQLKV